MTRKKQKPVPHISQDGSREHVFSWTLRSSGDVIVRCSEPNCEANFWPGGPNYREVRS